MAFKKQPFLSGDCGHYSMMHALYLLGIDVPLKYCRKATGVGPIRAARPGKWGGVDEKQILKGLKNLGRTVMEIHVDNEDLFRAKIKQFLTQNLPIIIAVKNDRHWIVLSGIGEHEHYHWVDSKHKSGMALGVCDWEQLKKWINNPEYYGMVVS